MLCVNHFSKMKLKIKIQHYLFEFYNLPINMCFSQKLRNLFAFLVQETYYDQFYISSGPSITLFLSYFYVGTYSFIHQEFFF